MLTRDPHGAAWLGGLRLSSLLANGLSVEVGGEPGGAPLPTPAYVYDLGAMAEAARALAAGFGGRPHLVAFAVKACSAGPVVRRLRAEGCGAEVVSGGELALALGAGVPADDILMSGVGKTAAELDRAVGAGERGILAVQLESVEEVGRVAARARALGRPARVSIRVNPGVVADTHAHVATGHDEAKFGVALPDLERALAAIDREGAWLRLVGLSTHIGSQLTRLDETLAAADVLLRLATERERASAQKLDFIDFGGGFGIDYGAGCATSPAEFAAALASKLDASPLAHVRLVVEPGRALVGPYAVLLSRVVQTKESVGTPGPDLVPVPRRWLVLDAGMNDLVRPAMYGAVHRFEPVQEAAGARVGYRVVGPVCESSDDFGEHAFAAAPDAVLARDAGAYGFTMASEYNGRSMPLEVFVEEGRVVGALSSRSVDDWVRARLGG